MLSNREVKYLAWFSHIHISQDLDPDQLTQELILVNTMHAPWDSLFLQL